MSRKIDLSNPEGLSDNDRKYLRDRGRLDMIKQADHMARINAAAQSRTETKKIRQPAEVVETEEAEPYEQWTVRELRQESRNRKLSTDGDKDELVARLEAHDQNSD